MLRFLRALCFATGVFVSPLAAAAAQISVNFDPGSGTYTTSSLNVIAEFCSWSSPPGSRYIAMNGVDVTWSFSYVGPSSSCTYGDRYQMAVEPGEYEFYVEFYNQNEEWTTGGATYTVNSPDKLPASLTVMHNQPFRDATRCVADCFAATAAYSTPAYRSIDVARGVTLLYRSDRAKPIARIELDAHDASPTPVNTYMLVLRRPNGSNVTFTTGDTIVYFAGASGATRLVAQFHATDLATGVHQYTAIVRSRWNDGTLRESTTPLAVLIDNGVGSVFGAGWEIAGLQRAYPQSDVSVLVASGDGSLTWFGGCAVTCQLPSPAGEFSTFHRLANGTYERRYPDGTIYTFSAAGHLTQMRDRLSNTTAISRDGSNRVTSITDPASYAIAFAYDGSGRLSSITTPGTGGATRLSTFTVNGSGDLTFAQDPDGIKNFDAWYTAHKLDSLTDRRGGRWKYSYSTADGGLEHTDAPTIAIHNAGNGAPRTTIAGPRRAVFARFAAGQGVSVATAIPRNVDDIRAWVRTPRNHTTYFTLDRNGQPTQIDYALGPSATALYNGAGQPTRTISPSSHRIDYTWTGPNLTKVEDVTVGSTVNATYESTYNRPDSIWGHTVAQKFAYNDAARTFTVKRGGHPVATYAYDTFGRIQRVTDPGGHVDSVFFAGSGLRNTDSTAAPGARRARFRYDAFGRVIAQVNPEGQRDSATYDVLNRQLQTIDAANEVTTFVYDSLFLRSVTDARSQAYSFVRNALGWVEEEYRPGSTALRTAYDSAGNVVRYINRENDTTTFTFDALNRLLTRNAAGDLTTYSYLSATATNEGRFTAANAESADTIWTGAKDRIDSTMSVRPGGQWSKFQYSYNTDGLLSNTLATWGRPPVYGSRFYALGYNPTKAVLQLNNNGWITTLNPGTSNEDIATTITYPGGLVETRSTSSLHRTYDSGFTPWAIDAEHGAELTLDQNNRILERGHPGASWVRTYEYDNVGRISNQKRHAVNNRSCGFDVDKGLVCTDDRELLQTDLFSYDAVGNQTSGVTLQIPGNRVLTANTLGFTYDADGNVIGKTGGPSGDQTLSWNALGQLISVTTASTTVTFGYDAFGRRVRKTVNGVSTAYVHDGDNLFLELDTLGYAVAQYTYWGLDKPHSLFKNAQMYYYIHDPVGGSVRALVRQSDTAVVAAYSYAMFGQAESVMDSVGNSLRFAGREYDSETGFYFNRARYYDPSIGRFISEDPIGVEGGVNLYAYAANDPVNNRDPFGQQCEIIPGTRIIVGAPNGNGPPEVIETAPVEICNNINGYWPNGSPFGAGGRRRSVDFLELVKRQHELAVAACKADIAQAISSGVMETLGLEVLRFFGAFPRAILSGNPAKGILNTGRLAGKDALDFGLNVALTPSAVTVDRALSRGGTPNPLSGVAGLAYDLTKSDPSPFAPFVEAFEAGASCRLAWETR